MSNTMSRLYFFKSTDDILPTPLNNELQNIVNTYNRNLGGVIFTGNITFVNVNTGPVVTTPDGTKTYLLGVANNGALTSTRLT